MRREEVVVVGGGLAGVMAALTARNNGSDVTLLDEQTVVGGYLRAAIGIQKGLSNDFDGKRGFALAETAWEKLYDAGVNVQLRSTVWGWFEGNVLGIVNPDSSYQLRADKVIVASGSTDVAIPFQGWDLPGVMTARAALIAMNVHRVLPGHRIALLGNGSDADELAESLEAAGVNIAARVANTLAGKVGGNGQVEWANSGGEQVQVDAVITANGIQPDPQIALQALVDTRYSPLSGVHVPLRTNSLETTVKNLWVAGDAGGPCTSAEAAAEGVVAGEAATEGRKLDDTIEQLAALRSHERKLEIQQLQPAAGRT